MWLTWCRLWRPLRYDWSWTLWKHWACTWSWTLWERLQCRWISRLWKSLRCIWPRRSCWANGAYRRFTRHYWSRGWPCLDLVWLKGVRWNCMEKDELFYSSYGFWNRSLLTTVQQNQPIIKVPKLHTPHKRKTVLK